MAVPDGCATATEFVAASAKAMQIGVRKFAIAAISSFVGSKGSNVLIRNHYFGLS
jgi:hypothetical protein